jgi:N-acyl-phosphatidylethanolamine-hydrolysing phospholipase D
MHWGTFRLTDEPLDSPPALLRDALARSGNSESEFRIAGFGETITFPHAAAEAVNAATR